MASIVDILPLALLLFLITSSLQIQARESRFFSKAVRSVAPNEATAVPSDMPEEPAKLLPQSQNGYGLYGRGPDQFLPTTATDNHYYNNVNGADGVSSRFSNNEFTSESYENKDSDPGYQKYYYNNNNNARHNAHNVPSKSPKDWFTGASYENNQYRMGDNGFMEKGKYFYDVNAERNRDKYDSMGETSEGYKTYNAAGAKGGNYGYGGYRANSYVNNNGMEGYHYNQENQENQEEYIP